MPESKLKYRIINVNYDGPGEPKAEILLIYTGGTMGMMHDRSGALVALNFNQILQRVPALKGLGLKLTIISFPKPLDSSNVEIRHWQDLGYIIYENYQHYDGFVVLHGTDTMAYTASALSYMLDGLNKPVIFTGAQLPISAIRSDARANLVSALEIAAAKRDGHPVVPEVCIYFDYQLMRGNRSFKKRSSQFAAFGCENYPIMAKVGINITYHEAVIRPYDPKAQLQFRHRFDPNVLIVKLFPALPESSLRHAIGTPGLRGLILETFGSGNAPTSKGFLDCLRTAVQKGIVVFNVSQLIGGIVSQGRYETSVYMNDIGVVGGRDITTEAAVTKLMFLLGNESDNEVIKRKLVTPLSGEMMA
jgi:L-asparaginase